MQTAESLRSGGFDGEIVLLGDETAPPYSRPPLSKAYLMGKVEEAQLYLRGRTALDRNNIALMTETHVTRIDRAKQSVILADGRKAPYGHLVLATGARSRTLTVPGAELEGVVSLRTIKDAREFRRRLAAAERIVVIGGGFVGLEFAAVARQLGKDVTVLEAGNRLMARAVSSAVSDWFLDVHRAEGVRIELGAAVCEIRGKEGRCRGVLTTAGEWIDADLIVSAIGAVANDALAADAGLETDHGIIVDKDCRTQDPLIMAIGDCAAVRLSAGGLQRLESVFNAIAQAKVAAAALLNLPAPTSGTPWFWTDQYGVRLQMVGTSLGQTAVVERGDKGTGSFSLFYYREDALIGVDAINRPSDHLLARRLLDSGISPNLEVAAAPDSDLPRCSARS
ncbi:FAD-dependent oxidoreductase [soil metagenome]